MKSKVALEAAGLLCAAACSQERSTRLTGREPATPKTERSSGEIDAMWALAPADAVIGVVGSGTRSA